MKRFPRPLNPFKAIWDRETADELYEFLMTLWKGMAGAQGTPTTPTPVVPGVDGDPGSEQSFAPSNHTHSLPTSAPETKVGFDGDPEEGDSSSVLRSDARLILEDGDAVGDTLVWDGEQWVSTDPIPQSVQDQAATDAVAVLAELKTITYLLKVGLNVPDEVESIRKSFCDDSDVLAELKTITYYLSAGLNERPQEN